MNKQRCVWRILSYFILFYFILFYLFYFTFLFYFILFSFILFYFTLFYFILLYFILLYFILSYFILFYFILFYFILLYFILLYFILFYFILFYFILFYFILFYFILFYFILFYFVRCYYKCAYVKYPLRVVCFLLGNSTASEFCMPTPTCLWRWNSVPKRRHTKFKRRRITQKKNIQHREHGESLKSRMLHPLLLPEYYWNLNFLDTYSKNTHTPNSIQIGPNGSRVTACGQTDVTKLTVVFHSFANAAKELVSAVLLMCGS
jgi:hypothetical protein